MIAFSRSPAPKTNSGVTDFSQPDFNAPEQKTSNAYLQHNEYVVYNEAHVRIRYLFRVRIN